MRIAILGSTSHIAKGLIVNYLKEAKHELVLFARWGERAKAFIHSIGGLEQGNYNILQGYDSFHNLDYDAIINCVGVHERNRDGLDYTKYFTVTEYFDNLVLDYLENHPHTKYISMSSGATSTFDSTIKPTNYYAIVRVNAEAKHRAHFQYQIIDLRIFNYFSRYVDLDDGQLITDVVRAVRDKQPLVVEYGEIMRNYIHPHDLFALVNVCFRTCENMAMEAYASRHVTKSTILHYFSHKYGLKVEYGRIRKESATGFKANYYPSSYRAGEFGYVPLYSSLDTIMEESKYILGEGNA